MDEDPVRIEALSDCEIFELISNEGLLFFRFKSADAVAQKLSFLGDYKISSADTNNPFYIIDSSAGEGHGVGTRAFSSKNLLPHTDYPADRMTPEIIVLLCEKPAEHGGDSIFVDGRDLHRALMKEYPDYLRVLSCSGNIGHRYGETIRDAPIFVNAEDNRLQLRARFDEFVMFRSEAAEAMLTLTALVEKHRFARKLESGEGYILQNLRFLHGRTKSEGSRRLVRLSLHVSEMYRNKLNSFAVSQDE